VSASVSRTEWSAATFFDNAAARCLNSAGFQHPERRRIGNQNWDHEHGRDGKSQHPHMPKS
jgi:hypothetical protein